MRPTQMRFVIFALATLLCSAGVKAQAQEAYPDGALLRAAGDGRVYVVFAGRKRLVPNESVFNANGWSWGKVRDIEAAALNAVPDTRVIKSNKSATIFDISSGVRLPVTSPADFQTKGYGWAEVTTVLDEELASYPLPDLGPPAVLPVVEQNIDPVPRAPAAESLVPVDPIIVHKISLARQMLHGAAPSYPQETRVAPMRALNTGSVGLDVERVQKRLQELGFFPAATPPNGYFGPATLRAVKAFQAAHGIESVGRVGEQTIAALLKNGLKRPETGSLVKSWRDAVPTDREVMVAAWNKDTDDLRLIKITLKVNPGTRTSYEVVTHTPGFAIRYRGGNGVNVHYAVTSPAGYQVLANRFPIFDAENGDIGSFPPSEEVYVPYSDDLRTPEIVAAGRQYLDATVAKAIDDLRARGMMSVTGKGLLADLIDPSELKNIAIIEHMNYDEFRKSADKHGVVNRFFTVIGTNKEDAYRFAGSSAGALGIAQFIGNTYLSIRDRFPAAELKADFRDGMADHVNAFKAMALYLDVTNSNLESTVREKIAVADPNDFPALMAEVRAAAYNGGPVRVKAAVKRNGPAWNIVPARQYGLFAETKDYLEKFKAMRQFLAAL